ncbi:division/cell wall cluster transcriptional repressor MraZ [Paludicola sp. MB14-C6]|uniref:division/cell wall cluster transcriptional repressor MraZ n=1 Tax=Paludihabitans sp. MB14-C6 TaxID=3070656 RepID=UPI0027DBBDD7|nr:division/cell wall cluster transcriptional repressor MraZ [Paludicola sp. MB14-C6]WMJ23768.1 division/cell wall cluster transcriptional repressor MraZ [Paludicola sp. MB14-C6]
MLIGEYSYSIDVKGRLNFPAKLRENLGGRFIITKGLGDNCLFVYSMEEWQIVEQKIKGLPLSKARNLQRFFFASALEVEPDKQGRIVIPNNLREYANLDKDVMIIGASTHCEIWSKENWDTICTELDSNTIAQAMDELGF